MSTRFVLVGARRVFASSTSTCFLSGCRLCSSHCSHPSCFCGELVEAVSEAFSGGNCGCLPHDGFWRDGIVFVAKHIREKSRCKKRICDVLDPSISSYNKPFSPWMYLDYALLGVTSFVFWISPWAVSFVVGIEWFRVVKPLRSVYSPLSECNSWMEISVYLLLFRFFRGEV